MKKRSDNSFSVSQLEKFLNNLPQLGWTLLDTAETKQVQDKKSRIADYKISHNKYDDTFVELKELGNAGRFQKQQDVSDEIERSRL